MPPAVEVQSLNHWTPREVLKGLIKRLAHGAQPPPSSASQSPQSPEVFPGPGSEGSSLEAHSLLIEDRVEGVGQLGVPGEMRIWKAKLI